ncbi:MAG: hypothetical protein KC994_08525 [Candidatus Omnitrophica bacterium]|nr:hypothetical protein [Candidatus Omnitrophota bacterium]
MSPIQKSIHQAKLRMRFNFFLKSLFRSGLVIAGILIVPAVAIRLLDLQWNPFLLLWGLALAIPYALLRLYLANINDNTASLEVDERFHLFERISSAWALRSQHNPMVHLLQEDADHTAGHIKISERFPIVLPKRSPAILVPLLVFAAVSLWLPPLPKSEAKLTEKKEQKEDLIEKEKADEVAKILKKEEPKVGEKEDIRPATGIAELRQPLSDLAQKLEKQKMTQKEALSELSNEQRKLENKKERLAKLNQAKSQLSKDLDQQKFTKEMRESLSEGKYSEAAKGLQSLAQDMADGSLSSAEMDQLGAELESLSKALEGNTELQKALDEAMEALKESKSGSNKGKNLSPEQMKKLQQALAQASKNLEDLQRLSSQLKDIDGLLKDIDLAKLGLAEGLSQCQSCGKICSGTQCSSCNGKGLGMGMAGLGNGAGAGSGSGLGMGGPGRGKGNVANRYEDPNASTYDENISTQWHPGQLLGVVEVEGENSPADSYVKESAAFVEVGQGEQSVIQEEIPPGYESIVRGYFDEGQ